MKTSKEEESFEEIISTMTAEIPQGYQCNNCKEIISHDVMCNQNEPLEEKLINEITKPKIGAGPNAVEAAKTLGKIGRQKTTIAALFEAACFGETNDPGSAIKEIATKGLIEIGKRDGSVRMFVTLQLASPTSHLHQTIIAEILRGIDDPRDKKTLIALETKQEPRSVASNESFFEAVEDGRADNVEPLLKGGVDPNCRNDEGDTPLLRASNHEAKIDAVKVLLEYGADVNGTNGFGVTPLMLVCALHGSSEMIEEILMRGADINLQNKDGVTALMFASEKGHLPIVKMLIERGADANIQDVDGMKAVNYAKIEGRTKIVQLLQPLLIEGKVEDLSPPMNKSKKSKVDRLFISLSGASFYDYPERKELGKIINELCKTKDPRVVTPIIKKLGRMYSDFFDWGVIVVKNAFIKMGSPCINPVVATLKNPEVSGFSLPDLLDFLRDILVELRWEPTKAIDKAFFIYAEAFVYQREINRGVFSKLLFHIFRKKS